MPNALSPYLKQSQIGDRLTSLRITRTGSFHCFSIPLHYVYRARFRIKNFMEYRKIRGRTTKSAYKTFTARTKWEKVEDERIFVYAKTARRYACARPRSLLHAAQPLLPRTLVRSDTLAALVHSVVRILLSFKARYTSIEARGRLV